ncbi:MAG TPA: sterol desaturase family protein [Allocoleopsis sp.]
MMNLKTTALISSLVLFGVLELLFPFFQFDQSFTKRISTNIGLGCINILLTSFTTALLLNCAWDHPCSIGIMDSIQPVWLGVLLSFLVLDGYMYGWHRLMHTTSIGWRFHAVHHTERTMNVSTAYRFHAIEVLVSNLPKILLIWLCGIPAVFYLLFEAVYAVGLVFHHSNWRLPYRVDRVLSYFIVTPNYHRLHHSQDLTASRSNYASLLTLWDKLFRSRRYPIAPKSIQLGLAHTTKTDLLSLLKTSF